MNEYQRANLRWLLQGCKRNFPQLDTGDWFMELMHMTDGADVYPNANADAFDAAVGMPALLQLAKAVGEYIEINQTHLDPEEKFLAMCEAFDALGSRVGE